MSDLIFILFAVIMFFVVAFIYVLCIEYVYDRLIGIHIVKNCEVDAILTEDIGLAIWYINFLSERKQRPIYISNFIRNVLLYSCSDEYKLAVIKHVQTLDTEYRKHIEKMNLYRIYLRMHCNEQN